MAHYNFDRIVKIQCGDVPVERALSLFKDGCSYEAEITRIMRSSTCTMKSTQLHKLTGFYLAGGVLKARTNLADCRTIKLGEIVEVTRRPIIGG